MDTGGDTGIYIYGDYARGPYASAAGNLIAGNIIGLGADGVTAAGLGNAYDGIVIDSAPNTTIGGSVAAARNIISNNTTNDGAGILITNYEEPDGSYGTVVQGNYIGTDITGTLARGNYIGIDVEGASSALIGTDGQDGPADALEGNLISGNLTEGIRINAASANVGGNTTIAGASNNVVAGNRIGTNAAGTAALGNAADGVQLEGGATHNWIGVNTVYAAETTDERNIISGNLNAGVEISGTGTSSNTVAGDYIGTDYTGTIALGNGNTNGPGGGVLIDAAASGNLVGTSGQDGSADVYERNVISGNAYTAVVIQDAGTSGNVVAGNYLGTTASGESGLGNGYYGDGVDIINGADDNWVGVNAVYGPENVDQRNVISGNNGYSVGVWIVEPSSGNVVAGNYIGTDARGTTAIPNNWGIFIDGGSSNLIGTTGQDGANDALERNIISGNASGGIEIYDTASSQNVVAGNYIGTDVTGTVALGNSGPGLDLNGNPSNFGDDVEIVAGATSNWIGVNAVYGPENADQRNVISGDANEGVEITGTGTTGNTVAGNFIGTDYTGTHALPNYAGVEIDSGSTNNLIGTNGDGVSDALERNVISGNLFAGVWITGAGTDTNVVAGNYIGTDVSGNNAVGNGSVKQYFGAYYVVGGVVVDLGASNNLIGTSGRSVDDAGQRNIISGNTSDGVNFYGSGTSGNVLAGNDIGTNPSGTSALANGGDGVWLGVGVTNNYVGVNPIYGSRNADQANVISGNADYGIELSASSGNVLAGNLIGTNASGSAPIPNYEGVNFDTAASNNLVGTSGQDGAAVDAIERNVISGNDVYGIYIRVAGTTGNVIAGNYIGTNAAGTAALANGSDGVLISLSASGNWVGVNSVYGPENAGQGNVISGNSGDGVELSGTGTTGNTVAGNYIGTDYTGTHALPNYAGVEIDSGATGNLIGTNGDGVSDALEQNVISGNRFAGVWMTGAGTDTNVVAGNYIGTDVTGTIAIGNGGTLQIDSLDAGIGAGVVIEDGASSNLVGTTGHSADDAGQRNLISGNLGDGVDLYGSGTSNNVVAGNYVGTNPAGTGALANQGDGFYIAEVPSRNWIGVNSVYGAEDTDQANVIAGNNASGSAGIEVYDSSGTVMAGNLIGVGVSGSAVPNYYGVVLVDASNNLLGTSGQDGANDLLERNVISGNANAGVDIFTHVYGTLTNPVTTGNVVAGNVIGTTASGTAALGNGADGVLIASGAYGNFIGFNGVYGPGNTDQRNIISGNSGSGVDLTGAGTIDNVVAGNYLGLDTTGTQSLGNTLSGITIQAGASSNTIGGTVAAAHNVSSGNHHNGNSRGIYINGSGTNFNVVVGNYIGTNAAGTAAVANDNSGILISSGADANTIGGTAAVDRNIVSGNTLGGIVFDVAGTTANLAEGNWTGLNAAGTGTIANLAGIAFIDGSSGNSAIGNVVSGNTDDGFAIINYDTSTGSSDNLVQGNLIGTDPSGTLALGNSGPGIVINAASTGNTIGGTTAAARNIISGNASAGVSITGTGTSGNFIIGNYIGTNQAGATALGNRGDGVILSGGTTGNWIGVNRMTGPESAAEGNVISGNTSNGVEMSGTGTTGNVVAGNDIGTNASGSSALANAYGVVIDSGASANLVGTTGQNGMADDVLERNVISGNAHFGVYITGAGANNNVVAGNYIGTDSTGEAALANASTGVDLDSGPSDNWIGENSVYGPMNASQGNLISGNESNGITLSNGANANVVAGNFIGTDATGQHALANAANGVSIFSTSGAYPQNNVVGLPGAGNVISGDGTTSVLVRGASGTVIQGNKLGTTADGLGVIPGDIDDDVQINEAPDTLIGGTTPGSGNLIALGPFNSSDLPLPPNVGDVPWDYYAVDVWEDSSTNLGSAGTVIEGNLIGTDITGTQVLGNPFFGVLLVNVAGITVGGTAPGAGNVIAGGSEGGIGIISGSGDGLPDLGASDNLIEGNKIGVNFDGSGNVIAGLGNGGSAFPDANLEGGIYVDDPADPNQTSHGNTIGGTATGAANIISGNFTNGVVLTGAGVTGNLVEGNLIGTNLTGSSAVANTGDGVYIAGGASNNTIGGTAGMPATSSRGTPGTAWRSPAGARAATRSPATSLAWIKAAPMPWPTPEMESGSMAGPPATRSEARWPEPATSRQATTRAASSSTILAPTSISSSAMTPARTPRAPPPSPTRARASWFRMAPRTTQSADQWQPIKTWRPAMRWAASHSIWLAPATTSPRETGLG